MATRIELFPVARCTVPSRIPGLSALIRLLLLLVISLSAISPARAQTSSQQYVYLSLPGSVPGSPSSLTSGFAKASQTGALNSIAGSPFADRLEGGLVAMDGQGRFLFVLNPKSNDISMFQVDQVSGALSEVPGSPFAVPPTVNPSMAPSQPISLATEASGKFLFVGYLVGDFQGTSAVVSLVIDTSGSSPVLITPQSTEINNGGAPIQLLTDPKGLHLYVGLGTNSMAVGGAEVYSIDSSTGTLGFQGTADTLPEFGQSYAMDPRGRFFFAGGHGTSAGFLESCIISPVDGTANTCLPLLFLNTGDVPTALVTENSGQFLYVDQLAGVAVYSVNQTTGALTQVLGPLSGIQLMSGSAVADPMGPYLYSAEFVTPTVLHAYQVDQQTGNLTEIPGSPFSSGAAANCCGGLAISGNPAQAVSGPAVSIFPSTANFSAVVGITSPTQIFSIVNVGNQLLALNSISIAGANASSFSQINICQATLSPNANCSVSISFTPATVGALTANLQVADNAPGTPQTLVLNGTGFAPAPAVTFSPATAPSFPDTTQGASSAPQTLTVISSGNTTLHFSAVSLAGPNPSDFSFINNCTAPLAPGVNCTLSLVFNPAAPGQRIADLLIADDASGSPQTLVLSGTGIALVPALSLSPPVPSFPATTQGTSGAPQTLSLINSGNAPLQVASVSISGSNASEFSPTSNCTAPLAPAASCTISLVFNPLASGQRTANLIIADDAPGSPQTFSLIATANPAFSAGAVSGSSTSATVSAGQTAQFQLQLTPAPGFTATVSLTCSGAPIGAVCQAPSSVSLANGAAATFTVTVTTSGSALLPPATPLRFPPTPHLPVLASFSLAMLLLFLVWLAGDYPRLKRAAIKNRFALCGSLYALIFCAAFSLSGCGGGSAAVAPPPIVTPSGTSILTISLAATSPSGQPLQLQPIQLTLTVK